MAIDVEELLAPVSEDAPAGEDLSYDSERYELEQLFEAADASPTDEDEAPPEVDWRRALTLIERQFARTKDLWLAVYLCRAGARMGVLETIEAGAEALAGLMERYWESVHPTLDELGVPGRKAPCDSLTSFRSFLRPMESTILFAHPRLGRYSAVDLERFRAGGAAEDGYGMFRGALDELPPETLTEARDQLDRIEAAVRRADAAFTAEAGSEATNFSATYEVLERQKRAVGAFIVGGDEPEDTYETDGYGGDGGQGARSQAPRGGGGAFTGRFDTREDVVRALDAAMDYFARFEPASPVPLALSRAKAWIGMDFLSILKDVAPDGVDQAALVLNLRPQEESY